jgi:glutathione peroxidase
MTIRLLISALATVALCSVPAAGCGGSGSDSSEVSVPTSEASGAQASESILRGELPLLNGDPQKLARFEGDVVLVVNTASECGYTSQFDGLQRLYEERREKGFVVLGFPADDVAGQEPRDDAEIAEFCEANFGVEFPMFAKSNVTGEEANPLFKRLAAVAGEPTWNFNKYLLDRKGRVVEHYDQGTGPDDPELVARIDELL